MSNCTCDLMDPSLLTDPAQCPVHRTTPEPSAEREWCENIWPDGTCPRCGHCHNVLVRREWLEDLKERLRAVEGERDASYCKIHNRHGGGCFYCANAVTEYAKLEAKLAHAEQRVAALERALQELKEQTRLHAEAVAKFVNTAIPHTL